jgi:uncharacterized protein YuzE
MKFLNKYNLLNSVFYLIVFYQFFKLVWVGYKFDSRSDASYLLVEKRNDTDTSMEKKFLTDLKYKKEIYFGERNLPDNISIILDTEYKVIGCRFSNSHESLAEHFCLNKKFLPSTLLGSIRLIEL